MPARITIVYSGGLQEEHLCDQPNEPPTRPAPPIEVLDLSETAGAAALPPVETETVN